MYNPPLWSSRDKMPKRPKEQVSTHQIIPQNKFSYFLQGMKINPKETNKDDASDMVTGE